MSKYIKLCILIIMIGLCFTGCSVLTEGPADTPVVTKIFITESVPFLTIAPTPVIQSTVTFKPIPTPTLRPDSGICRYGEEIFLTLSDREQIGVLTIRVDGQVKILFSTFNYEDGITYYADLFTRLIILEENDNGKLSSDIIEGEFELSYNALTDSYLSSLSSYIDSYNEKHYQVIDMKTMLSTQDYRLLYEDIIPEGQRLIVPWDSLMSHLKPEAQALASALNGANQKSPGTFMGVPAWQTYDELKTALPNFIPINEFNQTMEAWCDSEVYTLLSLITFDAESGQFLVK